MKKLSSPASTRFIRNALPPPFHTPQQQQAIAARGDVLVVAGAGAGKTQTVVDRCLAWLLDETENGSVDEILMATFTDAAAAELRLRLRQGLAAAQAQATAGGNTSRRLAEQLALLDNAAISTLHSFCLQLVTRHFYELGLDPKVRVLPEARMRWLQRQALDQVLERAYGGQSPADAAIRVLIQAHGGDWDQPVRELVLKLHKYAQTLRDPAAWLAGENTRLQAAVPQLWLQWRTDALRQWREQWLPRLLAQPSVNTPAKQAAAILQRLPQEPVPADYAAAMAEAALLEKGKWPVPKKEWIKPVQSFFDEAEFLTTLCQPGEVDPLLEDWQLAQPNLLALLDLTAQFTRAYQAAKRQEAGLDFSDLEQFALQLLWKKEGQPSAIALQWRKRLRLIFVDEFQDINGAQEAIIEALAREAPDGNRFLVGDVKQSIYGFRLADPRIFTRYHQEWRQRPGAKVIPLTANFRSHEGILHFVNALFGELMTRSIGGIDYDEEAKLVFGQLASRSHLSAQPGVDPPVEIHLRCPSDGPEETDEDAGPASNAELEARLVGARLRTLFEAGFPIVDRQGATRPAQWGDMVVLLRARKSKVESYVQEFARLGIPLATPSGGFYESLEVRDLLGLLQLLDNPYQDIPLLGVLHSPLAGLTAQELALIRPEQKGSYWSALEKWHGTVRPRDFLFDKVTRFLNLYKSWRALSRQSPVAGLLERIIDQTQYAIWLAGQERGAQKAANVQRLLEIARQFDADEGESLHRFVKFTEDEQEEDDGGGEPAVPPSPEKVRLMTIHQSKGLEFPIVAVADLGKTFNLFKPGQSLILDEEYGLCPKLRAPESPQLYPSLPYWLAERRQRTKSLGEELRLLYVALTRPSQRLLLFGTAKKKRMEQEWPKAGWAEPDKILSAKRYLDWIGPWLAHHCAPATLPGAGVGSMCSWHCHDQTESPPPMIQPVLAAPPGTDLVLTPERRELLTAPYPFLADTQQAAKTSVTTLRRQLADEDGLEAWPQFRPTRAGALNPNRLSAAEVGSAHHLFLQLFSLNRAVDETALREEAQRLQKENLLTAAQAAALDCAAMAAFWQSSEGLALRAQANQVRRELAFTARFSRSDFQAWGSPGPELPGEKEFVIVQGVIDLAVFLPNELWLLDFKTDSFPASELDQKTEEYRPQLILYALALQRIHRRPVTHCWLHFLTLRRTVKIQVLD